MSRRKILAGNWKMNKTSAGAVELTNGLKNGLGNIGDKEVIIFPSALYVREVVNMCKGTKIDVGVQNMYFEEEGAFTGENSPAMVKDSGCKYILIGHSERRHIFHETDADVNKKMHAAFKHGLEPMLCIGELLEEREAGKTNEVNKRQTVEALKGISAEQMKKVIIAYEPVWAIGTGKVATPEMAQEVHAYIRSVLSDLYGKEIANIVPILYGGSVKADNIAGLYIKEDIDGALVGGACLTSDSFLKIVHV